MSKMGTFDRVKEAGIIPAIRTPNRDEGVKAAGAILNGGIRVIEVSLALANALDVLDAIATAYSKSMLVGAGTVIDAEGVRQAALAGARFIVPPGLSSEAVNKAQELGVAIFAGALSPTEVQVASAAASTL